MMRAGTVRIALGMETRGFFVSPAAIPIVSIPPNENITTVKQAKKPVNWFGMKPPSSDHRLVTDGATESCA